MKNWPIDNKHLFRATDKLLLAVSGGVDSVVLCELCHQSGYNFAVAHANFQLRGEESEEDERFVRGMAEKYAVKIFVRRFDTVQYAKENKTSIQVAARELRYQWFNELLKEGYDWVLTAHHRDDNIETVLMNFFRGTGISGLRGMLPRKDKVIRPLLSYSKEDIYTFASRHSLQWRNDSSNESDKYSRNYFRQTIIPLVTKIFPEAEQNIAANIERFRDVELLYQQAIQHTRKKILVHTGNEVQIPILKLQQVEALPAVLFEILKEYGFTAHQIPDVLQLMHADQGKYVQSATHRIIKNRNWLIIADSNKTDSSIIVIEKQQEQVQFALGQLQLKEQKNFTITSDPGIALLNAKNVQFPLILRKWKTGDYFYPLGMKKKKKISRFLIDKKLSPTDKERVWVVESRKRICWIVGMRIDERFKVLENTDKVIRLSLES